MNAPLSLLPVRVRAVALGDAAEEARVDAFVSAHPEGTPFHRTAWIRAVASGCGQRAHALVAERGRAIVGTLPLTELHSPIFGRSLVSSGFAVGGGILAVDAAAGDALAEAAWSLACSLSCPTLELRGGWLPGEGWHRDAASYAGFARPLAAHDDAELRAISRKQRAEVRRALGYDLEVAVGSNERLRAEHHAVYAESVHNLGTPVFPRALFDAVLERFGDDADILVVRAGGTPVAAVLSLYDRGTVMPYWGGGTRAARGLRANDLMYFALMRHARERGCTRFDFGRSKPGTGAFAFKRNWGFEPTPLVYAARTADGRPPRRANPLAPENALKVRLWKALPLALANIVGPPIARGIG